MTNVKKYWLPFHSLGLTLFAGCAYAAETTEKTLIANAAVNTIVGLLLVLGLIGGLAWAAKRLGYASGMAPKNMQVLGALSVGNRERVVHVKVGNQELLLGVAPGRVTTLHVIESNASFTEKTDTLNDDQKADAEKKDFSSYIKEILSQPLKK